ncbi:MAG: hypothetical protein A2Y91_08460 [Chloroflexi bacterium RBG_13_54_8]|nr:MAG: hypothetical protein A2Y91_08460 [Chloroflexi bacterium RBG_13_54_8]
MVEVREVAQSTYSLDCGKDPVFNLSQVAYLLVDDMPALIDPGSTSAAAQLLGGLDKIGLDPKRLAYIIPTHIHLDHAGGAGYLAGKLPETKVVLHPRGASHLKDPSRLIQSVRAVFGEKFEETLGPILPVPQGQMHVVHDGEVIHLGRRELKVFFAPGHAPHHIALWDSLTNGLFCGDSLGYISEDMPDMPMPVGLPPFDPQAYLETIDRLAGLSPGMVFYAHHGVERHADGLIVRVRETLVALCEIISQALKAGEDERRISGRVLEYLRTYVAKAELPIIVEASIAGYIDYFRNKKRPVAPPDS